MKHSLDPVNRALFDIRAEMDRAEQLHGPLPWDPVRSALILVEEAGEVAKAALGVTRTKPDETVEHLREELAQTAATAIRMLVALEQFDRLRESKARLLDIAHHYLANENRGIRDMAVYISGTVNAAVMPEKE